MHNQRYKIRQEGRVNDPGFTAISKPDISNRMLPDHYPTGVLLKGPSMKNEPIIAAVEPAVGIRKAAM